MQWAGEEYLLEELEEEYGNNLTQNGKVTTKDAIYWIGYIYRYWHFYKQESSKQIYKQSPYETMRINYLMFHTMSPEMAIDNLIEIYIQKHFKNKK